MIVGVRTPEEFGAAFAQLKEWRAQALLNAESTLFLTNKRALLDGAAQNRYAALGPPVARAQRAAMPPPHHQEAI